MCTILINTFILTLSFIICKDSQIYFENLEVFTLQDFLKCVDHFLKLWMKSLKEIFNPLPTNVPLKDKSGSWFVKRKYTKNTSRTMTLYVKCHSFTDAFQTFC